MKANKILIALILLTGCLHAAPELRLLKEFPPDEDSPAAAAVKYLKAGSENDVETMKELTFGIPHSIILKEETRESIIADLENIDWEKEVQWAQLVNDDSAKVAFRYFFKDSGRKNRHTLDMKLVDGVWKYGF